MCRRAPSPLEHGDVVADPVFLVLCNAFGDPGDVADFLREDGVSWLSVRLFLKYTLLDIPALSVLAMRTQWRV